MKFVTLKENLNKGLNIVSRVAGKNLTLPILNNILISAEKNFLVSPRNTKEFADRIRELLELDESKRNNLKLSLLEWVSRFDIKNAANRFRKIIEDPLDAVAGEG